MIEVQKVNPLVTVLQKVFSQLWNAGLFENVDDLRGQTLSKLKQKRGSIVTKELLELRLKLMKMDAHRHLQFKTSDEILLDGMLFHAERKKVILFVPGIGSFYEKIGDPTSVISRFVSFFESHFPNHAIFTFNNRGIGESGGSFDLKNLQIDTASAYQYLKHVWGYAFDDILLYTHSLGGLHAVQGAGLIQKKFPQATLSAVSDRSFGDLGTFTKAFLKDTPMGDMAAGIVDKLGMNLSAKPAWKMLKGKKLIIASKHDRTIPYEKASFYKHVEQGDVFHLEGDASVRNHHTRSLTPKEAAYISQIFSS